MTSFWMHHMLFCRKSIHLLWSQQSQTYCTHRITLSGMWSSGQDFRIRSKLNSLISSGGLKWMNIYGYWVTCVRTHLFYSMQNLVRRYCVEFIEYWYWQMKHWQKWTYINYMYNYILERFPNNTTFKCKIEHLKGYDRSYTHQKYSPLSEIKVHTCKHLL